jgi:hypothetical protein
MKQFKIFYLVFGFITVFSFSSCEKDKEGGPDNEQELITTVRLTFTLPGQSLVFNAKDTDGDGGLAPVIDAISLNANTTYGLKVEFLDESKTPVVDITSEVREEGAEHLVCFAASGSVPTPADLDKDANGKTLGLSSTVQTGAAGSGTLKVTLKHLADKSKSNACSTGETDAEVTFNVTVK